MCVLYKPAPWKVPHEYSAGAGGGNDVPKVTQLLDSGPGTQTPFSAPATSLSVSFPFRIQHGNDHNSLSSRLVTARAARNPREWRKKDGMASFWAPGTWGVHAVFLRH